MSAITASTSPRFHASVPSRISSTSPATSPTQYLATERRFPCKAELLLFVQSGYSGSPRPSSRDFPLTRDQEGPWILESWGRRTSTLCARSSGLDGWRLQLGRVGAPEDRVRDRQRACTRQLDGADRNGGGLAQLPQRLGGVPRRG